MRKVVLLGLLLCLAGVEPGQGAGAPGLRSASVAKAPSRRPQVVLVLLDRVAFGEWQAGAFPHLHALMRAGAVGLLNTQTAQGVSVNAAYVTLGAGTRAAGSAAVGLGFNVGENYAHSTAGALFQGSTGLAPRGQVVHLGIGSLVRVNAEADRTVPVGALGSGLHAVGKKTAALGNADLPELQQRRAVTVATDQYGRVDYGNVGPTLNRRNPRLPYDWETDYARLWMETERALTQADLLVIELGDTTRLDAYQEQFLPRVYAARKQAALRRADAFLGRLWQALDHKRSRLLLLSPTPATEAYKNKDLMTLVVMAGAGVQPGGILTSATTRQRGVVANIDLAPTVLAFLGGKLSPYSLGAEMSSQPSPAALAEITALHARVFSLNQKRVPFLRTFIILQIIGMVLVILALLRAYDPRRWYKCLRLFLVALVSLPLAFLLLGVFEPLGMTATAVAWLGLGVVLVFLFSRSQGHPLAPFLWAGLATVALLLLDTASGGRLIVRSLLGYDLQSGARYYGIGNEYMGLLIGAGIMIGTGLVDRFPRRARLAKAMALLLFALITYTLLAPGLGVNAGGALSAAIGFGVTALLLLRRRWGWRQLFFLLLALVGVLALMVLLAVTQKGGATSHIARAYQLFQVGGLRQIGMIISRKLAMNYKLLKYTIWTRVLLTAIGAMGVLLYRPVGVLRQLKSCYPYASRGLAGGVIGSVAVLLLNDSGVVGAATAILYPIMSLLYLALVTMETSSPA